MRIRLRSDGFTGQTARIWLDDVERLDITQADLSVSAGGLTTAVLHVLVEDLDVDVLVQQAHEAEATGI